MLLDDVLDFLSTGGLGLTSGTNLFAGTLPDSPDRCVVLYETGGFFPIHANANAAAVVERPRVQVVTRAPSFQGARQLAHNVFRRLDSTRGATINGVFYHWISAVSSPAQMGDDGSGRPRVVCNFDIVKNLHTSTST